MTMGYTLKEHRLILFGGQGSPTIFSPNAVATAEQDVRSINAGSILLSRCHAFFLEEIASLDTKSRHTLAIATSGFTSPFDLLKPPVQYHTHPVLQATTIYLCQLLRYLAEILHQDESYECSFDKLQATAGFSFGILPAAVVAGSRTVDEFVASGVQGFRLAFWIACRTLFWAVKTAYDGDDSSEYVNPEATLSLVTRGLSQAQIEHMLSHNSFQGNGPAQAPRHQQRPHRMKISAISSSATVSISGPVSDLCAFQRQLQLIPNMTSTFAHVHGWYHGGDQLEVVVQQVLEDLSRRAISFPSTSTAMKPIYSTLNGTPFDGSTISADDFLAWLARHLLVHCVNWYNTAHKIAESVRKLLEREPGATVRIFSFGPSSASLFPDFNPPDDRIAFRDLSPFKTGGKPIETSSGHQNDVAIVGIGVQLPKGRGTEELWETISQGLNAVQEIPENRFEVSDFYSDDSGKPRTMRTKHGAFLEDPFCFDNSFFNISPREARSMDPQQRVLLHTAQEAFEDAGYVEDSSPSFQRATMGCYIGLATGDYTDNLRNDIDTFYSSGILRAFHSGRISYFFRLSGPSIVTDTACSSSTVSIYQACRALQNGDCTAAIAGGVNVITSPDMYLGLARGHFLSQTGNCKPFDAGADGYCRAEGCALFVLKRLSDAVAEGDRIHGVIRNVLVNQSGNSSSITHPHSQTQADLLKKLLNQVEVDPGSVDVIEAHGTGTQAGDAREVESLRTVFGSHHSVTNPLMISSIKGNIGHCEAASGAAGLVKLLLMLRERKVPMQAGLNRINPAFGDLVSSGLMIPRRTETWNKSKETPRRAVLNNFGAAGSNASLLLEDWAEPPRPDAQPNEQDKVEERSAYVFSLSARSERALQSAIARHADFLGKTNCQPSLMDICYTATARRHHRGQRNHISLACSSVAELLVRLQQYKVGASKPEQRLTAIIFIFTGQGAVYRGMGKELMGTSPPFRDVITSCDRIMQGLDVACPSILGYIQCKDQDEVDALTDIEQLIVSQCACVALEYALARMFMSWDIKPTYVMGHSLGEYVALCISGVLTLEDMLRVVASRAKMMGDHCLAKTSGMLACNLAAERVEEIMLENPALAQLTVACLNSPGDCVVGGPLAQLDKLQAELKTRKVRNKQMNVPYAFHTSAMDPISEPLRTLGRSIRFGQPTIPVMSTVNGRLFRDDVSSDYFADHARSPVRFADSLFSLQMLIGKHVVGDSLFLEVGPQPSLLPMLWATVVSTTCTYLSTLQKGLDAWVSISETLATISSSHKIAVNWREVFAGTAAKVTSLPGHLLEGTKFLTPFQQEQRRNTDECTNSSKSAADGLGGIKTGYNLLPWLNKSGSSSEEIVLETDMTILGPLISGHDVGGTLICPASTFHELVLEAAEILLEPPDTQVLVVSGISFASPLVHVPSSEQSAFLTVRVCIKRHSNSSSTAASFKITSRSSKTSIETVHCTGSVSVQNVNVEGSSWVKDQAIVARQSRYFSGVGKSHTSSFRTKVLYEAIFTRVVKYSPLYQTLVCLSVADSNLEGFGLFEMPHGFDSKADYMVHPVFTDTLLHTAGFIANLAVGPGEIAICAGVETIDIAYRDIDYSDYFTIYCSLLEIKGAILADAIALQDSGKVIAVARSIEFKRLQLSTFQQAMSRISSTVALEPQDGEYVQYSKATPSKLQLQTGLDTPPMSDEAMSASPGEPRSGSLFQDGKSQVLKDIILEVGGFAEQDVDYTVPLGDLGIDSLMQIEVASKLTRLFPGQASLSHHALSQCETLEAMDAMLSEALRPLVKQHQPKAPVDFPKPDVITRRKLALQSINTDAASSSVDPDPCSALHDAGILPTELHVGAGTQVPLYLFHDGSGQVGMYRRLHGHDRTTYAIFDPHCGSNNDKRQFHCSVNQMAEEYVTAILSNPKQRSSPLILGGWSFGGVVAFEAAQQLAVRGFEVKGLVLIDSPSPIDHEPLPAAISSCIARQSSQLQHVASSRSVALEEEFISNASLLATYKPESFHRATGRGLKTVMLRSQDVLDTEALYGVRYDWLSRQDTRAAAIVAWEEIVGGHVEVLPIPGNHFEPFLKDMIGETSAQLWTACRHIEQFCEFDV